MDINLAAMQSSPTLPLLEHDYRDTRNPMSRRPLESHSGEALPKRCLMSFMRDVLEEYVASHNCEEVALHESETGVFPLYLAYVKDVPVGLIHAPVGAPAAAMIADRLIYSGVDTLAACGGCGVLNPISSGKIIIPKSAVRDEGTSYHYIEPSADISLDNQGARAATQVLEDLGIAYETCKVWTTDGFFRETPSIIELRRSQGCSAVDMECAALAAVAQCYGATFFEVLYSGDSLENPHAHDDRDWLRNTSARNIAFHVALSSLAHL